MTIAQMQPLIDAIAREEVRKAYAAQDEQRQQADDIDAQVDAEIEALAQAVDSRGPLREMLGGVPFKHVMDGDGDDQAQQAALAFYHRFVDAMPDADAASPEEVEKFAATNLEGHAEEIKLLSDDDAPVHLSDPIDVGSLSDGDRAILELEGEQGLRDPLRDGGLSDWARAAQVRRMGLERLASGISAEEPPPPSGPVTVVGGKSFGDGPMDDASVAAGFDASREAYDPQDRVQDAARRAAERERTGIDNRTCDEVARGVPDPGQQRTDAQAVADDAAEELEKRNAYRQAIGMDPLPTPRAREASRSSGSAAESEVVTSAKFPGELARDSEYREPRGPGSR